MIFSWPRTRDVSGDVTYWGNHECLECGDVGSLWVGLVMQARVANCNSQASRVTCCGWASCQLNNSTIWNKLELQNTTNDKLNACLSVTWRRGYSACSENSHGETRSPGASQTELRDSVPWVKNDARSWWCWYNDNETQSDLPHRYTGTCRHSAYTSSSEEELTAK